MKHIYTSLFFLFATFLSIAQNVESVEIDAVEYQYERIKNFHSDIVIHEDGDITVTENITFYVTGQNIQRGIVRSLPYYYRNQSGRRKVLKLKDISIKKDGVAEPFHEDIIKDDDLGYRELYIGDKNGFVSPGLCNYEIQYSISNQVFHYDGFDELYWNVTGNDWVFSMDSVSATITLPNTKPINISCYWGSLGSKKQDCKASIDNNKVNFYKNNLDVKEGLTVAVSFASGVIKPPPPATFFEKYFYQILAGLSIFILSLYYLITWFKYGKPGVKPAIIPTFKPPLGFSPSVVQYLYKLKMKDSIFSTAIVSMAVKGALKIELLKNKYVLINLFQNENKLSIEELEIYNTLFKGETNRISLSGKYIPSLSVALKGLSTSLEKQHDIKKLKPSRFNFLFIGAALSLIFLQIYFFIGDNDYSEETCLIPVVFAVVLVCILMVYSKLILLTLLGFIVGIFAAFIWLMLVIVTLLSSIGGTSELMNLTSVVFVLVSILGYALYCYFFNRKTAEGLVIESQLDGFRLYLKTAEEHRLNMLMIPEHTLELFEELLPYAIALGVENEWNSKFKDKLLSSYQPDWYSGDRPYNKFSSSLSSSINRASTKPSSSGGSGGGSGSRGGGSSGGGRGGGGGRGW